MIVKPGSVIVSNDDITVRDFTFDCNGAGNMAGDISAAAREAVLWAIEKLQEQLQPQQPIEMTLFGGHEIVLYRFQGELAGGSNKC